METPLLAKYPALEVYLESMETAVVDEKGRRFPAYLITSPEFALKKLLAAGFNKIFQLGKVFRDNEPWGGTHNPEFTMLEWYRVGVDYTGVIEDTERLICHLLKNLQLERFQILDSRFLAYQGRELDLTPPWLRLSMREAWEKYAGVNLDEYLNKEKMFELVKQKNYIAKTEDSFDDLFFKIFLSEIEPRIAAVNRPVFLYDYPIQMAALSRKKKEDTRYAERVELYIAGLELANGYSELIDWKEQEERFKENQAQRGHLGKKEYNIDNDFISALKAGLPECAGIALGVDRLAMLLLDAESIEGVMPFFAGDLFKNS